MVRLEWASSSYNIFEKAGLSKMLESQNQISLLLIGSGSRTSQSRVLVLVDQIYGIVYALLLRVGFLQIYKIPHLLHPLQVMHILVL